MHKKLLLAYGNQPNLLDELELLEAELHDIDHDDMALTYHPGRKCVLHQFKEEWDVEYIVLQHWADHVGAHFTMTEEPDKKGFFSAFILL